MSEEITPLPNALLQPLPKDALLRIERLARDLAWGTVNKLWGTTFHNSYYLERSTLRPNRFLEYIETVWGAVENQPTAEVLIEMGYLRTRDRTQAAGTQTVTITTLHVAKPAFDLLNRALPISIFVSYKRSTSSALAMLIWAYLQRFGLDPFLDIRSITGGDEWHTLLETTVREADVVVALIAPGTLDSPFIQEEIRWATESNARIIPILHDGVTPDDLQIGPYAFLSQLQLRQLPDAAVSEDYYTMLEFLRDSLGILRRSVTS